MKVCVHRARDTDSVSIDFDEIYEDSIRWTTSVTLNKQSYPKPFYFLKCQIDYSYATKMGLASGYHSNVGKRANVYLYASENKEKEYIKGYTRLCELAGSKPRRSTGVPHGQPPCTKRILQELGENRHLRSDIRKRMMEFGYEENTIRGAFKRLENQNKIMFSMENHSHKRCEVWATKE